MLLNPIILKFVLGLQQLVKVSEDPKELLFVCCLSILIPNAGNLNKKMNSLKKKPHYINVSDFLKT